MTAYNMYTNSTEIKAEVFDIVSKEDDIINRLEGDSTNVRGLLLKKLNERLRCLTSSWNIVEVKYVANTIKEPLKYSYLTKEICESGTRYMKYDLEDPFDMCGTDIVKGMSEKDLFKPIPIPTKRELAVKYCTRRYVEGLYPFDKYNQKHVNVAMNEACSTIKVERQTGPQYSNMCNRKFENNKDYDFLPFCDICGQEKRLWRFGPNNSHILCEDCFVKKFEEVPCKYSPDAPVQRTTWKKFLKESRDVSYREYSAYCHKKYGKIDHRSFDENNYRRAKLLLASTRLPEICKTLSRSQNIKLYELSHILRTIAIVKDGVNIEDVPLNTELLYLLSVGRDD